MKMHFYWKYKISIALCVAFLTMEGSFGELIMIRHPPINMNGKIVQTLTCISENDGSVVVWNDDFNERKKDTVFTAHPVTPNYEEIVKINRNTVDKQNSRHWASTTQPQMGPLFDHRWGKGINERLYYAKHNTVKLDVTDKDAMVFSARGLGTIFVWIGSNTKWHWQIKFSNFEHENLTINSCDEVNCSSNSSPNFTDDKRKSKSQWRTFIIKWVATARTISASVNGAEQEVTKTDIEWKNITRLEIQNEDNLFLLWHYHFYFLSRTDQSRLSTREFNTKSGQLCFDLPIILCFHCQLNVNVVDRKNRSWMINSISGNRTNTYGGLPAWRIVKFNTTLDNGFDNPIKLIFSTSVINGNNEAGLWAIGDSQPCGAALLRSTQSFSSYSEDIACQKLSYGENSVVYSNLNITGINSNDLDQCLQGGVGLFCDFGCHGSCNGTSICNPSGCTCAPGFKGDNCTDECTEGYYGYNCQRSCAVHCKGRCNKITGLCDHEELEKHFSSKLLQLLWPVGILICVFSLSIALYRQRTNVYSRFVSRHIDGIAFNNSQLLAQTSDPEKSLFRSCAHPQKLRSFEKYAKEAVENGVLRQQFLWLPRGLVRPCKDGKLPENRSKNRNQNSIAYDETRVILVSDSCGQGADYINANYIKGYCNEKAYIATQAPTQETVVDFWKMIWQEKTRTICMLVNIIEGDKKMCEQYWPEVGKEKVYGDIVISNLDQTVFAHYTYRSFSVSKRCESKCRKIEHLQYTGWPEEGVPMYPHSVSEYLNKLLSIPTGKGPIVVHCSSGMGRTGCIILCDICLRYIAVEGTVDVFAQAKDMYRARGNMLDDYAQYVLAHLVPTHCLLFLPTKVLCRDISRDKIEEMKKDLPVHIKRLEESPWTDKALRPVGPVKPPIAADLLKNRFPKLMPVCPDLVTLKRYPSYDANSDYISAVSVDGVKIRKQYLASQLPMPSTLNDFWRLIVEQNVELVVVLQRLDLADQSCCEIIPHGKATLIPVPYITVKSKISYNSSKYFKTDKLLLTDTSEEPSKVRNITVLSCNNWSYDRDATPPPPEALVALWKASEKISRVEAPTLVLCHDGITGCGLYLALSFMLERMTLEQECDVILAVKAIRRSRLEFVYPAWQFEYLYDAAVKYAEEFRDYANFM